MSIKTETIAYSGALILVVIYGVVGTLIVGQNGGFNVPITTLTQAVYFTISTISTVGFGEIYPVTQLGQDFVISLIIVGIGVFLGAVVTLSGEFVSRRVKNLTTGVSVFEKRLLNKHIILIGTNMTNQYLAKDLKEKNERYIVITSKKDMADEFRELGLRAVVADYASEDEMYEFGMDRAKAVIIDLRDNSKTVYALLVAIDVAKSAKIIVISPTTEAEKHMRHLSKGRATIINPADIAARTVAETLFK